MVYKTSKVVILTLNWNGSKHLKYFLKSVEKLNYSNFSTIGVDNG